ncbi:hypothetical protein [Fulvivirga kasyanovii]|uniref:DUF4199 domain-containing protein n=1 Tax=Fulvivirga kasyanovii TaxID=396812 RepID=A0ABW9RQG3_9BACT|nr:hypothetical protein [Fulvivirga kasyanovii]MTI26125.1 hypothetical protein [Fulvivirga kasyanovii]
MRHQQNREHLVTNANNQKDIEYFAYSYMGLYIIPMIGITLIRNSYVFNNWFPIGFIVQFLVQFVLLVCFILPDKKPNRYIASHIVVFFLAFGLINGLFRKDPKYSKIEMTQVEVEKLSKDVEEFSIDITTKIKRINEDMNSALLEIKERDKQIKAINDALKLKENEHKRISEIIEIDKERAEQILTALNVRPPTILDRVLDGTIGALIGIFLTFLSKQLFLLKKSN